MFLKIVEPESVAIYEMDTSELHYGHAYISSLEELDSTGVGGATPYHRYGDPLPGSSQTSDNVAWVKFLCDNKMLCVAMTMGGPDMRAYLMSDSGETIERIV